MVKIRMPAVTLACAALTLGSFAHAQVKVDRPDHGDQYYEFDDDLVDSEGSPYRGFFINARVKPKRSMLLRVRASFVPEMLRSVEHL